jgi:hypothetical protein
MRQMTLSPHPLTKGAAKGSKLQGERLFPVFILLALRSMQQWILLFSECMITVHPGLSADDGFF